MILFLALDYLLFFELVDGSSFVLQVLFELLVGKVESKELAAIN